MNQENNEFNNQPTNVMPEFIGQPTMAPVAQVEPVPAAPIMPEPVLIQPEVAVNPEVSIMPEVAPVTVGPEMIQPVQEPTTVMQDTPLFNPNAFEVPVTTEPIMSEPVLVTPVSPVMPEPVLNQPETMVTPTIIATPEVVDQPQVIEPLMNEPITLEPVIETQDNLSKLQELLNSNGYEYKVYSNDTTHCVILELSKN